MGQAQLLLIVLGVVLVGIAIIAGINAYDTNNRKASVDALTHDAVRISSDIQMWVQKPEQFGGPAVRGDLTAVASLTDVGYEAALVENSNGECQLTTAAADPLVLTCTNASLGTVVTSTISGITDADITMGAPDFGY